MNIDNILGFIIEDQKEIPFSYKDGILTLFHSNIASWKKEKHKCFLNWKIFNYDTWIGEKIFEGICQDDNKVRFCVSEDASTDNGYYSYSVKYVLKYSGMNHNQIRQIELTGKEINYFLEVGYFNKFLHNENSVSATIDFTGLHDLCSYQWKNVDIKASYYLSCELRHKSLTPLKEQARLLIEFSTPQDEIFTLHVCHHFLNLFQYLSYRRDIELFDAKIRGGIENTNDSTGYGILHEVNLSENFANEANKEQERIIKFEEIKKGISKLISAIAEERVYLEHIVPSLRARSTYRIDRIILNFAAFEREFHDIYGVDYGRSEKYITTKNEAIQLLKNEADKHSGDKKKYYKSFATTITKTDNSYEQRLEHALKDCREEMKISIANTYRNEIETKIADFPRRMNALRNDSVHANSNWQIEPININDFSVLEDLIYAIRLKNVGIDTRSIQKCLASLRGYSLPDALTINQK